MSYQTLDYVLFSSHIYDPGEFDTDETSGFEEDERGMGVVFNGATVIASYISADTGFGAVACAD